jgi:hypothetical protein
VVIASRGDLARSAACVLGLALLLSALAVDDAAAGISTITCSGRRLYDPGTLDLTFRVEDTGTVRSVDVEGLTKLVTTQVDEKHIAFDARTARVSYALSFGRQTKDVVFSTADIDASGHVDKATRKVFIGKCTVTP